jgi:tripeptidyl-peptidase-1
MSLGSLSAYSCDLLCEEATKKGHTKEECTAFLQKQRQVCMFLSEPQVRRINTAFQVLGVRGVSVFAASGDGGSHFSFQKFPPFGIGSTLNQIACQYQMPVAPTDSPYVTAVGGEMWDGSSAKPVMWSTGGLGSGGGFGWQFSQPEYQKEAISLYMNSSSSTDLPPASSYNQNGRGYPDMSAVGVQGTSQSCPIAAGIWSLLIDHRLNAGLPPLGFVAPRLWKIAQKHPGEAFFDITSGNSKTSCSNGFPAAKGWDPTTGWGRPIWDGMVKHFGSDSRLARDSRTVLV